MEDALKEYAEYDLIVELLQNALDSIDQLLARRRASTRRMR
jgi:hypothetical protein